jgi:nonsense-mediated mRNA decay protein 3
MADEFCVVCGATGRPLTDGVCASCAADRTVLLRAPERAVVVICPHCCARKSGAVWKRAGASPLLTAEDLAPLVTPHPEVALREIQWEETASTATVRDFEGTARVRFRGIEREVPVRMSVKTEHQSCTDCSRKSGRYYTAVIQLRGAAGRSREKPPALRARLEGIWAEILAESRPDWRRSVSWQEDLPEGWDVFFTDTLAARAIAKIGKQKFGASVKESATLFGRKDGQDVYRVTFCLRFPKEDAPAAS